MPIMVKVKSSGQRGIINESDFDPNLFEQVQQEQKPAGGGFVQGAGNILESILKPITNTGQRIGAGTFELGRSQAMVIGNLLEKLGATDQASKVFDSASRTNPFAKDEQAIEKLTDPLQIAKDSAGVLSYGIPAGGASSVLGKTVAPGLLKGGAIAGGLGAFGASESEDATELLTQSLLGAGGGALTAGVLDKLFKAPGAISKVKNKATNLLGKGKDKVTNAIADDAAKGFLKETPPQFEKVVDHLGKTPDDILRKYTSAGDDYNTLIGEVADRGNGGKFKTALDTAEQQIQEAIKVNSGASAPRISVDDFVKGLEKEIKQLELSAGNETNVKALKELVKSTRQKYSKGITLSKALDIKRAADSKFGSAILNENTGSVSSQFQKAQANFLRKKLKVMVPEIAEALDTQAEVLTMRPLISRARSVSGTRGSDIRVGSLNSLTDLINPVKLKDAALSNPKISSRLINIGTNTPQKAITQTPIPQSLSSILGQASGIPSSVAGQQVPQQSQAPNSVATQQPDITAQMAQFQAMQGGNANAPQAQDNELNQIVTALKILDPKNGKMYDSLLESQGGGAPANVGKVGADKYTQATTGANALQGIKELVFDDDGSIDRSTIALLSTPGKPGARQLDTLLYQAVDNYLRIQSGAAVPPDEVRKAMKAFKPGVTDSVATVNTKLSALSQVFDTITSVANQQPALTGADSLNSLLGI